MSTRSGEQNKKRGQKHQNTFKFKLDEKDRKVQKLLQTPKDHLCQRCFDQITWKIEYKKYKPLSAPAMCNDCRQKVVFKAYRALCDACAGKKVEVFCTPEMQKELNIRAELVGKKEQELAAKANPKAAQSEGAIEEERESGEDSEEGEGSQASEKSDQEEAKESDAVQDEPTKVDDGEETKQAEVKPVKLSLSRCAKCQSGVLKYAT